MSIRNNCNVPSLQDKRVQCKSFQGIFKGCDILCDCCHKFYSPSSWEKHCGGTWHRPWEYIHVIETGKSIMYYKKQWLPEEAKTRSTLKQRSPSSHSITQRYRKKRSVENLDSLSNSKMVPLSKRRLMRSKDENSTPKASSDLPNFLYEKSSSPLTNPQLMKEILTFDAWQDLEEEDRKRLRTYLSKLDQKETAIHDLFQTKHFQQSLEVVSVMLRNGELDPQLRDHVIRYQQALAKRENAKKEEMWRQFWGKKNLQLMQPILKRTYKSEGKK
jgi:hypothetical protein